MATSGTYTQSWPVDDLITEAWERCGKNAAVIDGNLAASARRSLQLMLIDWTNRGVPLWQVQQNVITLTGGVAQVTLPAYVVDVLDVYTTINGVDNILARLGRSDYAALSNKATTTRPMQFWVNRQRDAVVLNLYPTPDSNYTFTYYALRQPQDVSGLAQTLDAPLLWSEALASSLAVRLSVKFAPDRLSMLAPMAEAAFVAAQGENRERVPLTIMPNWG